MSIIRMGKYVSDLQVFRKSQNAGAPICSLRKIFIKIELMERPACPFGLGVCSRLGALGKKPDRDNFVNLRLFIPEDIFIRQRI